MALDTYAHLQTTIASYLQRSDLTSSIPDFISLCEAKVARVLRTMDIQATRSQTLAETNTLPTDYMQLVTLQVTFNGIVRYPDFWTPERMKAAKTTTPTLTGIPQAYTIHLGKTEYFPAPDGGTTYAEVMSYYQRIPALSGTSTNWLLTGHPDIYLYGALAEAESFCQNDSRVGLWKSQYQEAVAQLEFADDRKRVTRPADVELGLPFTSSGGMQTIESGF